MTKEGTGSTTKARLSETVTLRKDIAKWKAILTAVGIRYPFVGPTARLGALTEYEAELRGYVRGWAKTFK